MGPRRQRKAPPSRGAWAPKCCAVAPSWNPVTSPTHMSDRSALAPVAILVHEGTGQNAAAIERDRLHAAGAAADHRDCGRGGRGEEPVAKGKKAIDRLHRLRMLARAGRIDPGMRRSTSICAWPPPTRTTYFTKSSPGV